VGSGNPRNTEAEEIRREASDAKTNVLSSRLRVWGPAAAWAVVLFLLSAWQNPRVPYFFQGSDKVAHAVLYAVLGGALAWGRKGAVSPPAHWVMLLVGMLYGATDEFHQAFVRGRTPDWGDWGADVVGVLLGYTVVLRVVRWLMTSKSMDEGVDVSQ
jgi:VanZ family protein